MTHRHPYHCPYPPFLPILFYIHLIAILLAIPVPLIYFLYSSAFFIFFTISPLHLSFNPLSDLFSLSLSYDLLSYRLGYSPYIILYHIYSIIYFISLISFYFIICLICLYPDIITYCIYLIDYYVLISYSLTFVFISFSSSITLR